MKRGPHSQDDGHPAEQELLDLVDERLAPAARRRLNGHLGQCPACRAQLAAWRQLFALLGAERADQPPILLREWGRNLPGTLAPHRESVARRPGLLRLVADSWGGLAASIGAALAPSFPQPALRGAGDIPRRPGRRRLLFAAGRYDLDLEIGYQGPTESRRLQGQILPASGGREPWRGTEVTLLSGTRPVAATRLGRRGDFRLGRVRPGRYRLRIAGMAAGATPPFEV